MLFRSDLHFVAARDAGAGGGCGFTLIELLVVIAIIAILMAVVEELLMVIPNG